MTRLRVLALLLLPPAAWAAPPTDRFGDALPPGAVQRLGRVRPFQPSRVWNTRFSADGKSVVVLNWGVYVSVYDRDTGRLTASRTLPGEPVGDCSLLPGAGKAFLGRAADRYEVWDLVAGRRIGVVSPPTDPGRMVMPAPDGESLLEYGDVHTPDAGVTKVFLRRWDVRTGREVCSSTTDLVVPQKSQCLTWTTISPDGRHVLFLKGWQGEYRVACWDATTLRERWQREVHVESSEQIKFLAGDLILATADAPVAINLTTGKDRPVRLPPEAIAHRVYRSHPDPDVMLYSTGLSAGVSVRAWDMKGGKPAAGFRDLNLLKDFWGNFEVSPDGRFVLTCEQVPRVYDLTTGRALWPDFTREVHGAAVTALAFSADGRRLASAGYDQVARVWDVPSARCLHDWPAGRGFRAQEWTAPRMMSYDATAPSMDLSADGRRIVLTSVPAPGGSPGLRIFDTDSGRLVAALPVPAGPAPGKSQYAFGPVAFASTGNLVRATFGVENPTRATWALGTWDPARADWTTHGHAEAGASNRGAFAAGDERLITGGRAYDARTGRTGVDLSDGGGPLARTPDGRLAAGLARPELHPSQAVESVPIYRDLRVWDARTGDVLATLPWLPQPSPWGDAAETPIWSWPRVLALHPGGRYFVTADPRGVRLWDLATGAVVHTFPVPGRPATGYHFGSPATALAFTPDGSRLATGLPDGTILLWDVPRPGPISLPTETADRLWAELMSDDPVAGWRAAWLIGDDAAAVRLARAHVPPAEAVAAAELKRLLADVESPRYAVREKATRRLEGLADGVGPAAAAAARTTTSEETRVRLARVLAAVPGSDRPLPPRASSLGRAVSVVEHAGGPDARRLLQTWAAGTPDAWLTREATAALGRLASRPPSGDGR